MTSLSQINQSQEYINFLTDLKLKIHSAQQRSALAINAELIGLYWHIGRSIIVMQETKIWGNAIVDQLSKDLQHLYPGISGFSRSNLFAMRQMVSFFDASAETVPQAVGQLPWGHIRVIMAKIKDNQIAQFYLKSTFEYGWSRNILEMQIEQKLHEREGKAITNFNNTLTKEQSDLAQQTLKDPYIFDFLTLQKDAQEFLIERNLIQHITKFLLELGKGFAFIGNQYHLVVGNKDYYLDLLFYHLRLKCYMVIELKSGEFKPEYAGKLNFYLSAVDEYLRSDTDNPTIGIILCKNKEKIDVEFALRDINKPIGVSSFRFDEIPLEYQNVLPSVDEFEQGFKDIVNQ